MELAIQLLILIFLGYHFFQSLRAAYIQYVVYTRSTGELSEIKNNGKLGPLGNPYLTAVYEWKDKEGKVHLTESSRYYWSRSNVSQKRDIYYDPSKPKITATVDHLLGVLYPILLFGTLVMAMVLFVLRRLEIV